MSDQTDIGPLEANKEVDLDSLRFLRVRIPENVRLIPKELIEDIKGRIFTPEEFYERLEENVKHNPDNYLFVMVTLENQIEGFLWAVAEDFGQSLWVNTFSISKKYWFKGKAITKAQEFVQDLVGKIGIKRVFWITTNAKFFAKRGFKHSRNVLMEFPIKL